ncbi:MAG TPA: class I SAM-dependent methyltransferase [Acidobacteriota bacterium]
MIQAIFKKLTGNSPIAKRTWQFWYNFANLIDGRAGDLRFMNFGYAPEHHGGKIMDLDPADEEHRYAIQMYYHTIGRQSLSDLDVLEVGCGRGGGAASLMKYTSPRSLMGIDLSSKAISLCRNLGRIPSLTFKVGDAEKIPFQDGSFDAVVNVESSHCYPQLHKFFAEVLRVLKKGGKFYYADFRREEDLAAQQQAIRDSAFIVREKEDIAPEVLQALTLDSTRKEKLIQERIPGFLRSYFRKFTCTVGSENYVSLLEGRRFYHRYLLVKP